MMLDLAALYVDLRAPLVAFFGRHLAPSQSHLAEDLVQDVFVRAVRAAPRYRPVRGGATGWIWTIARNLLIDHQKSRRARSATVTLNAFDNPDLDGWLAVPDRDLEAVPDRLTLDGAMLTLTNEQRVVVRAWYDGGHNQATAAEALGMTVEGVKKLKYRALARMRRSLEAA